MIPISINDYFNIHNPWTKRLLGFSDFQKQRDIQQVENEYNLDKYAKLLGVDLQTIEEYKNLEFEQAGMSPITGEMIVSKGDDIFKTTVIDARNQFYDLIQSRLKKYTSKNICELGCGYGYNLSYLGTNAYGGEYSKNAVKLAKKLGLDVYEFNYYDERDYDFIRNDTTIFTTHSIEQIPDATKIIDALVKQKDKINYVVHLEPFIVKGRTSLIGLLRNKYIEMNDYNRNLIELLNSREEIEILELEIDIFGLVPLNSTNFVAWQFKK